MGTETSEGFGTQAIYFALEVAKLAFAGLLMWLPVGALAAILVWALGGGPGKPGARITSAISIGRTLILELGRKAGGLLPGMLAKAREALTNVSGARIILAERFHAADKRILGVRRSVLAAHSDFERKVRRMRAGQQGVDRTLQRIDATLEKVDLGEVELSEDDGPRRSGSLLAAVTLTVLAALLGAVNTMMLHEFFMNMLGVESEWAWAMAFAYTGAEAAAGIVLKVINRTPASMGRAAGQAFAVLVVLAVVAFETFLYWQSGQQAGALSEELVAQFPVLEGWLGAMGFVLSGSIVLVGYYGGSAWIEVQERSGIQQFRRTVKRTNAALKQLEAQIEQVRDRAAKARPGKLENTPGVIDDTKEAAGIKQAVAETDAAFGMLRAAEMPLHTAEDDRDGWGRLAFMLGMGAFGIATLAGAILLLQPILLGSDLFATAGPVGAPVFAILTVVMTMLAGYFLVPTLAVGRTGKLEDIEAKFRPAGPFPWPTRLIAGTIFTLIMLLVAVVGSYSRGRLDMPSLTMSLVLGCMAFGAGTQFESVLHGLFLLVRLVITTLLHLLATFAAWTLVAGVWVLWSFFWVIEMALYLLAVPVLWLFSKIFRRRQQQLAAAAT